MNDHYSCAVGFPPAYRPEEIKDVRTPFILPQMELVFFVDRFLGKKMMAGKGIYGEINQIVNRIAKLSDPDSGPAISYNYKGIDGQKAPAI